MAVSQEELPSGSAESQDRRPAPKGRPPKGYIWCGDGYVHHDSLAPYSHAEHEAIMLEQWRQARLQRYREDIRGFRTRRIETQAQARIAKGVKPRRKKLKNATLVRSEGQEANGDTDKSSTT